MNHFHSFSLIATVLLSNLCSAQSATLNVLPSSDTIDYSWLQQATKSATPQRLDWTTKQAPGFKADTSEQRRQALLSGGWKFTPQSVSSLSSEISLPHAFPRKRMYQSAWYATQFQLDELPNERLFILLNRVDLRGIVFLNGQRIGQHAGSYTPFEFEITNAIVKGKNSLAIYVQDRSAAIDGDKAYHQLGPAWLESDYSQGRADKVLPGGIDDIPRLELRSNHYIKDVFVKTSTRKQEMEIEIELPTERSPSKIATLSFEVLNWTDGRTVDLNIPNVEIDTADVDPHRLTLPWDNPNHWSPDHPHLYVLRTVLKTDAGTDILDTRFGFREFWIEGKTFMLNGVPTRLRGESTYRDFRIGNETHTEIFSRYKDMFGSNACRIHAYMPHGDIILAADEAGVLLINQSAIWSVNVMFYKRGGKRFLENTKKEFEEWTRRDRNSPSVVIWDVENEMLRYNHKLHLPWVGQLPSFIEALDDTRPFNFSGGGWFDPEQDMVSLHMQEHYTRIMRDWKAKGSQPLLMGEFWVGGRMEQRIPTSPEFSSAHERFLEEGEIYRNRILEMRELGVSGVMPFRLSLLAFDRSDTTREGKTPMRPAEVYAPIKQALQAETVFTWPRQEYASLRETLQRELVVCNDGETTKSYTLNYGWEKQVLQQASLQLKPAEQGRIPIRLSPPTRRHALVVTLSSDGETIASDSLSIAPIEQSDFTIEKELRVYGNETLAKSLRDMGLTASSSKAIPTPNEVAKLIWLIPTGTNNRELSAHKEDILSFLNTGGTILCLKQDQAPLWFPIKLQFWSAIQTSPHTYAQMGWDGLHKDLFYSKNAPILMKDHPIFSGLENEDLHLWDPSDGRVSDDVFARPSSVDKYESGNWIPLASGTRREHVSIAAFFYGKGTLLSSQLNLLENLENPQANRLFGNMLRYLSEKSPEMLERKIALRGKISLNELSETLRVPAKWVQDASPSTGNLMIAFEGSDPKELMDWANKGGTVWVASGTLSSQLTATTFQEKNNENSLVSKVAEHPLLGGVSSGLSTNSARLRLSGYFSNLPAQAEVLMLGFTGKTFWDCQESGPILFRLPYGKGEFLASSLLSEQPFRSSELELLSLILTNYGTPIENARSTPDKVVIKKTVPITIDGELNEWLEDMEDRFVTPYLHAQPIYLTSESIIEGPPEFDLNLSGINYLLWNDEALHIAGVVFGEERTFETGIEYGRPKSFEQAFKYGSDTITLSVNAGTAMATVNDANLPQELLATSHADSRDLTDATRLQFSYILASGKIASVEHLLGDTFEIKIPWDLLKSSPSNRNVQVLLSLISKGSKIQVPSNATPGKKSSWLQVTLGEGK